MTSRAAQLSAAARSLGAWGWGSIIAIVVALAAILIAMPGVVGAALAPAVGEAATGAPDPARVNAYRESFDKFLAQINGRSMFFMPAAPRPPRAEEQAEPEAPPEPARYGGPAIIAMINGTVWFEGGTRLRADEAASGGLRVVSIRAPWGARIEWSGKEWDVPLFDRTTERFLEAKKPAAESPAQSADEPPASELNGEQSNHE